MKDVKELWAAWVMLPKSNEENIFMYSSVEIKKRYNSMIETKYPYFISRDISTHYFSEDILEKEYRITGEIKMFYSKSKEKCIEWLNKERDRAIESCKTCLCRLENAEIKEVVKC